MNAAHQRSPRSPLKSVALWVVPTVVVGVVMSLLAAAYMGGSFNAKDNIAGFPLAVVNEDTGTTLPNGSRIDAGDQIEKALLTKLDGNEYTVKSLTRAQAQDRLREGTLYGVIYLPAALSDDLAQWTQGAVTPTTVDQPEVEMWTNPRVGSAAVSIATSAGTTALGEANTQIGAQLTQLATTSAAASGTASVISGTAAAALAEPLAIQVTPFNALPDGTGGGLSAFYYALLLVLAGFTGSLAANTLIDSRLGFLPTEFGPLYRLAHNSGVSRRVTLLVKWGVGALVALTVSSLYLGISSALGMPIDHPWQLWAFGAGMIFAVTVVVQTINALVGNAGMLVNMLIFVILGLPSAGGTLPIETLPTFFRWLSTFEPLHHIYMGTRSLLYFDASWTAGLGTALAAAAIATVLGATVGLVGTTAYDRSGLQRTATT